MRALTSARVMVAIGLSPHCGQHINVEHPLHLVLGAEVLGVVGHELLSDRLECIPTIGLNLSPLLYFSVFGEMPLLASLITFSAWSRASDSDIFGYEPSVKR